MANRIKFTELISYQFGWIGNWDNVEKGTVIPEIYDSIFESDERYYDAFLINKEELKSKPLGFRWGWDLSDNAEVLRPAKITLVNRQRFGKESFATLRVHVSSDSGCMWNELEWGPFEDSEWFGLNLTFYVRIKI